MTKEKSIIKNGIKKRGTHNKKTINGNATIVTSGSIIGNESCITMNACTKIAARGCRISKGNTITMTDIFRTNDENTIMDNDEAIMAKYSSIIAT